MLSSILRKTSFSVTIIVLTLIFSPQATTASISGSFTNLNNETVSYSEFNGRFLFVEAFQTTCGACQDQHPHLERFYNTYQSDVVMISISVRAADTIGVINTYLQKYTSPWIVGIDTGGDFANQFHISSTPTMILFDRLGNQLITKVGLTSYDELASNMNYYLSFSNPITASQPGYTPPSGPEGSVIEELFGSPIFRIGFFSVIVIMIYVKMTGGSNPGV